MVRDMDLLSLSIFSHPIDDDGRIQPIRRREADELASNLSGYADRGLSDSGVGNDVPGHLQVLVTGMQLGVFPVGAQLPQPGHQGTLLIDGEPLGRLR